MGRHISDTHTIPWEKYYIHPVWQYAICRYAMLGGNQWQPFEAAKNLKTNIHRYTDWGRIIIMAVQQHQPISKIYK